MDPLEARQGSPREREQSITNFFWGFGRKQDARVGKIGDRWVSNSTLCLTLPAKPMVLCLP